MNDIETFKYVDIAIDTRSDMVDDLFTYAMEGDAARVGAKVLAPFAGSRSRAGYVVAVRDSLPEELEGRSVKKIISIDEDGSLNPDDVSVARWMRRRYFCRLIDALACFAPPVAPTKRRAPRTLPAGIDPAAADAIGEIAGNSPASDAAPTPAAGASPPALTDEQSAAFAELKGGIGGGEYAAYLVHGVTGSGKTELYMRAAAEAVDRGRKVIVLTPEISLTPQLAEQFTDRFGAARVAVTHSKRSKGERYSEWIRIKRGEADIAIGARSAVFAPFENVGLIIVDEEHETTYKSDMTPKYDAIEVALKRAARARAVCVLGSATPSVVSMYRARSGVYRLLELKERVGGAPMPSLNVVDMREELKQGNRSIFSAALHDSITSNLAAGRRTILFLNRRGYSTFISCRDCGYVTRCPECGISMVYHRERHRAECHFCGKYLPLPKTCPECGGENIRHFGVGTEKVEALTRAAFPGAKTARLDLDSSARKGSAEKILGDFGAGKTDILIGTQMVAKGLDYENISPVGIIAADVSLNIPDFRAAERTFQLITQASGRAGRGAGFGEVYVQTYSPEHYAVAAAAASDYDGFYATEILVRRTLSYPPYSDLYRVTALADSESAAFNGAASLLGALTAAVGESDRSNILGPHREFARRRGREIAYSLNMKVMPASRAAYEHVLAAMKKKINTDKAAGYRIIIEVNPFS
ncbi:MAG: primosomal protein N' [Clostridiales Family XIII bacterium]|jgi:primosomal protein N' (replication factor Y)|nr:primosomal protein N' [Clostridiales Family XIII bacterium]